MARVARSTGAVVAVALAGCHPESSVVRPHSVQAVAASERLTVAVYLVDTGSREIVDEVRAVTISDRELVVTGIDPRVSLAHLTITPLADEVSIGSCSRARTGSLDQLHDPAAAAQVLAPTVRCTISERAAPAAKQLVRIHYDVASALTTAHQIELRSRAQAVVVTRYRYPTAALGRRGELAIFDGAPSASARPLVAGEITFDGQVAELTTPPRAVDARVVTVYDGGARDERVEPPDDPEWNTHSQPHVTTRLELARLRLVGGAAHLIGAPSELLGSHSVPIEVATTVVERRRGDVLIPLWRESTMVGRRKVTLDRRDRRLIHRIELAVSNLGDERRTVVIEEWLRPLAGRKLEGVPATGIVVGDVIKIPLIVEPRGEHKLTFGVSYPQ